MTLSSAQSKDRQLSRLAFCKVLKFVLQQIHYDKENFIRVPAFIRNGPKFQELAVKYNPELMHILFPTKVIDQN